jgi:hypothetical protein
MTKQHPKPTRGTYFTVIVGIDLRRIRWIESVRRPCYWWPVPGWRRSVGGR